MRSPMIAMLVATAVLAGCAGGGRVVEERAETAVAPGAPDEAEEAAEALAGDAAGYGESLSTAARSAADPAAAPAAETAGTAPAGGGTALAAAPVDVPDAAGLPLRAGSVDDNARFADYLDYRARFLKTGIEVHDRDVSERHVVNVADADGRPVLGATVTLLDGTRELQRFTSHADGRALLHPLVTAAPDAPAYTIRAQRGDAVAEIVLDDRQVRQHTVVLDRREPDQRTRLDVHFLIDATGSMDDEIDRLKATMSQVAARVTALPAQPDVRWGFTAYRDRGEAFLTRTVDFTADLAAFTAELADVQAADGGDDPEALNEALHAAVHEPAWDGDAVQVMFLVADAPPHLDYRDDADYADDMFVAGERGITIVPIASSGLDDQGEFVFRQLAQVTLGQFMFLTYGPGGQPGDRTTHDVDGYEVQSLDNLIVDYVAKQLSQRGPRDAQQ